MAVLLGAALVLILATVPLVGGRLSRLAALDVRHTSFLLAALALQVLAISVLSGDGVLHRALHLGSYVLAAGFVWANRRLPGVLVLGLGGALNALAIGLNDGVMPASEAALRTAGIALEDGAFMNSAPVDDARLAFLGDVFAVPSAVPLANVFSVGDVLLVVGAAILVHVTCRAPRVRRTPAVA